MPSALFHPARACGPTLIAIYGSPCQTTKKQICSRTTTIDLGSHSSPFIQPACDPGIWVPSFVRLSSRPCMTLRAPAVVYDRTRGMHFPGWGVKASFWKEELAAAVFQRPNSVLRWVVSTVGRSCPPGQLPRGFSMGAMAALTS